MTGDGGAQRSKVARLIEADDLDGVAAELEERWTRSDDRQGLRQLAEYFNQRLLEARIDRTDMNPFDGGIENVYRLLTHDDVSSGVRTKTYNRLERFGVDVEQLEEDFVSYQSVYTYLTKYRNVDPPDETPTDEEQVDRKRQTIQRLANRLEAVVERSLSDLSKAGCVYLGSFDVIVAITVHCRDCGTHRTVGELLSGGRCGCDSAE